MKQPNFFLVGAPKCGTTSLTWWLREHPNIFVSRPKEPNYFADDFKPPREWNLASYEELFRDAGPKHCIVAEASTVYLRSRVAIGKILNYAPKARFAVGIRNPVGMAASLHRQRVNEQVESEHSLERAWRLQEARRAGREVPSRCPDAKFLMYAEHCRLGEQVSQLLDQVPRERVFIYTLDELRRDPRKVWVELLDFLQVPDDGRVQFPSRNKARNLPKWLKILARLVNDGKMKLGLHHHGIGLLTAMQARLGKSPATKISTRFQTELQRYFREDIQTLSEVTGRDLSYWLRPAGASEAPRHSMIRSKAGHTIPQLNHGAPSKETGNETA